MSTTTTTEYQLDGKKYGIVEPASLLQAQTNGLLGVSITFIIVTWIAVSLRCYSRAVLLRAFGIDDWFMVITLILFTAYAIMCVILGDWVLNSLDEYAAGAIPATQTMPRVMIAAYCTYTMCMITFKLSLGFYFLKILSIYKTWRIVIWITIVLTLILSVFELIWTLLYPCQLVMQFFKGGNCAKDAMRVDWEIITAVWTLITVATDFTYGVLSILAIRRLQLPLKTKIQGAILCGLGSIGGLASLVRFCFLIAKWPSASILGQSVIFTIWTILEPGLGITAAALATLRPLAKKIREIRGRGSEQQSQPQSMQVIERSGARKQPGILTELELDQQKNDLESGTSSHNDSQQERMLSWNQERDDGIRPIALV